MSMFKNTAIWIKTHKRVLVILTLIFLISTVSFALGYLMASDQNHSPIIIEKTK